MSAYLQQWYLHCPSCNSDLVYSVESARCERCGFVVYDNPAPCVTVIVTNDQGQILLAKRGIEPFLGQWDLPGGFVQSGESFEEAAIREIWEETTLRVEILGQLGSSADTYQGRPTLAVLFWARVREGQLTPQDDVAALDWFAPHQLPAEIAFKNCTIAIERYLKLPIAHSSL